jgi:hypothetical protein
VVGIGYPLQKVMKVEENVNIEKPSTSLIDPSIDSSILTLSDNGNPFFKVSCSSSLGISCFLLFFWLHAEIGTRWGKLQCSDCDIVSKKFNWHSLILVVFLVLFFIFWNNSCSFVVRFRSFGYFCDCRKDFRYFLFPCSNFRLFMLESFCFI